MAPPSLVSKMSMIVPSHQVSSGSFMNAGPFIKEENSEPQQRKPFSATGTDRSNGNALPVGQGVLPAAQRQTGEGDGQAKAGKSIDASGTKYLSLEEISRHRSADDAWITVDGKVYDVTQFLETHPGGPEYILEHLQSEGAKDAGPLMRGKVVEDGHSHSKAAFRLLEQFLVGSVEASPGSAPVEGGQGKKYRYDVDLTKPIVAQVGHLGPDYDEWVHDPIVCKGSPRFFENDTCEFFTRTSWWVIPMVWCPVAFTMIYMAVMKEGVPIVRLPGLMVTGVIIWSVLEYLIHRFLFHMKTSSYWGNTLHYLLHGFHHKHPMDGSRLVFPPAFAWTICAGVWILMGSWLATYPNKLVVYASALLAYVVYDVTHYYLHFGTAFNDQARKMKRYHLNHHFKDQTHGYGITTMVWDWVFRTLPAAKISVP